eukprot:m51a1_g6486 hypothetical protein (405) ;mRNA; r:135201-136980
MADDPSFASLTANIHTANESWKRFADFIERYNSHASAFNTSMGRPAEQDEWNKLYALLSDAKTVIHSVETALQTTIDDLESRAGCLPAPPQPPAPVPCSTPSTAASFTPIPLPAALQQPTYASMLANPHIAQAVALGMPLDTRRSPAQPTPSPPQASPSPPQASPEHGTTPPAAPHRHMAYHCAPQQQQQQQQLCAASTSPPVAQALQCAPSPVPVVPVVTAGAPQAAPHHKRRRTADGSSPVIGPKRSGSAAINAAATRVIPPGQKAAAVQCDENGERNWVYVAVGEFSRTEGKYWVTDLDNNTKFQVSPSEVVELRGHPDQEPEFNVGDRVSAVFPGTTTLYCATVVSQPPRAGQQRTKKTPQSSHYRLEFDGDYGEGSTKLCQRDIHVSLVTSTLPPPAKR